MWGEFSANLREGFVDGAFFRPAFMFFEVVLQLLFGLVSVRQKLAAGAKRQAADVAIRRARRRPDEANDDHLAIGHCPMMAGHPRQVKLAAIPQLTDCLADLRWLG